MYTFKLHKSRIFFHSSFDITVSQIVKMAMKCFIWTWVYTYYMNCNRPYILNIRSTKIIYDTYLQLSFFFFKWSVWIKSNDKLFILIKIGILVPSWIIVKKKNKCENIVKYLYYFSRRGILQKLKLYLLFFH